MGGSVRGACKSREVPCTLRTCDAKNARGPHSAYDEGRLFEGDVMRGGGIIVRGRRFVRDDGRECATGPEVSRRLTGRWYSIWDGSTKFSAGIMALGMGREVSRGRRRRRRPKQGCASCHEVSGLWYCSDAHGASKSLERAARLAALLRREVSTLVVAAPNSVVGVSKTKNLRRYAPRVIAAIEGRNSPIAAHDPFRSPLRTRIINRIDHPLGTKARNRGIREAPAPAMTTGSAIAPAHRCLISPEVPFSAFFMVSVPGLARLVYY